MFITIYSTFNNPWASTEAGQWVEKQLDQLPRKKQKKTNVKNNLMKKSRSSGDGSLSGLLIASNLFLWVGIFCGHSWVKFLWNISMLYHWIFAFIPILAGIFGIFIGLKDRVPSLGTSAFQFNTTQEIDDAWHMALGTWHMTLVFGIILRFGLFLYGNFLADARREIEKSAQKQDPKNPFPDRPRRSLDSQFISTVLNGIQSMREKWEI